MKRIALFLLLAVAITTTAQDISEKKARKWMKSRAWAGSFVAASPDKHTDAVQFYQQYHKNKPIWDAIFDWFQTHDLYTIPAGKYYVCDTVLIKVQDANTRPEAQNRIEMHKRVIDFQWDIRGTECYQLYNRDIVFPIVTYNKKKDVCYFELKDGENPLQLTSAPNRFFMFFPSTDVHRAMIAPNDKPAPIRKIVVKIPFAQ